MGLFFLFVIAALEATAVSLPLVALTRVDLPWALLLLGVVLGWLSDRLAGAFGPTRHRGALLGGALVGGLLLPSASFGGPRAALGALLLGDPNFIGAYLLLLLGLYLFWRGARLDTGDSGAVNDLFGRSAAVAVGALVVGALTGTGAPLGSPVLLAHIVGLTTLGLLARALAYAQETAGGRLSGLSGRWLATLLAAVAAVVAVATLSTGLVGGSAGAVAAQTLIGLALLPFALIGAALAWVFLTYLAEPIGAIIQALLAQLRLIQLPEPPPPQEGGAVGGMAEAFRTIERLAEGATYLMALIPIAILVIAILLLRRRRPARARDDEERESLGLASSLGADLRELLGRLRSPFGRGGAGLQGALAALKGDGPTMRARRAYIRLLLLLEAREQARLPAQTPAEFAPVAAATVSAAEPVGTITRAYEGARYNPDGAAPSEADAAEAALRRLQRQ